MVRQGGPTDNASFGITKPSPKLFVPVRISLPNHRPDAPSSSQPVNYKLPNTKQHSTYHTLLHTILHQNGYIFLLRSGRAYVAPRRNHRILSRDASERLSHALEPSVPVTQLNRLYPQTSSRSEFQRIPSRPRSLNHTSFRIHTI
ncbi:unnamed protein product [Trichogramma brassicae]|uniref:Uncharacterized protein n=1 Tax=Trichogramma brassicae TaxID=86971 RepID=A0A6H5HVZ3_9HYME|nr:unnamed protein product [Trichogramma brassicae]